MKTALIFWGGWSGHQPEASAGFLASQLQAHGLKTTLTDSLDVLADLERLRKFDLIVPCWTMGTLSEEQQDGLLAAVRSGVGLGGIHGMADAFRGNLAYEWMVGGQFVGHPHVGKYEIRITATHSPITREAPASIPYEGEQYYLLTEPGIDVLATSPYPFDGKTVEMPVAWTKHWGRGRVFYASYGHSPDELRRFPDALGLAIRGMLWAARAL